MKEYINIKIVGDKAVRGHRAHLANADESINTLKDQLESLGLEVFVTTGNVRGERASKPVASATHDIVPETVTDSTQAQAAVEAHEPQPAAKKAAKHG
jgi:hypothetical protein